MKRVCFPVAVLWLVCVLTISCRGGSQYAVATSYKSNDEIKPYTQPYSDAYLLFGSATLETKLVTKVTPGSVQYDFLKGDTLIDKEQYRYNEKEFQYVGNENEVFTPGIPLLKYPFNVGDSWEWAGTYRWANLEREAVAIIKTQKEKIGTVIGEFDTIKVSVELTISAEMKTPSIQSFIFWIAPNKGIVQREFQNSGSREPMPVNNNSVNQ